MGPLGWIKSQSPQARWDSRGRFSLPGTRRSGFNSWNYEKFKCTGRCWGRGGGCPMVGGAGSLPPTQHRRPKPRLPSESLGAAPGGPPLEHPHSPPHPRQPGPGTTSVKSEPPASRRRRAGGEGGEAKSIRRVLNL